MAATTFARKKLDAMSVEEIDQQMQQLQEARRKAVQREKAVDLSALESITMRLGELVLAMFDDWHEIDPDALYERFEANRFLFEESRMEADSGPEVLKRFKKKPKSTARSASKKASTFKKASKDTDAENVPAD